MQPLYLSTAMFTHLIWQHCQSEQLYPAQIMLFVDIDGTLSPFELDPADSRIAPKTLSVLSQLQGLGIQLAAVTGRGLEEASKMLSPLVLPIASTHGLQITLPNGTLLTHKVDKDSELAEIYQKIVYLCQPQNNEEIQVPNGCKTNPLQGLFLEKKSHSVALHYRKKPELAQQVYNIMHEVASHYPDWQLKQGKYVWEILPKGADKGTAILQLLDYFHHSLFRHKLYQPYRPISFAKFAHLCLAVYKWKFPITTHEQGGRLFPIFIGDDISDEAGFMAVQSYIEARIKPANTPEPIASTAKYQQFGLTIKVGSEPSHANFFVSDIQEVADILTELLNVVSKTLVTTLPLSMETNVHRLILVSNRVKIPETATAGGLAVALFGTLSGRFAHDGIWVGWNGDIVEVDAVQKSSQPIPQKFAIQSYTLSNTPIIQATYITTALSPIEYVHYYCGFANNVLWPMLHNRADLMGEHLNDFMTYQQVNQRFAEQLFDTVRPNDVIWVHDYHFFSVAYYCRLLGMRNRIGFFLHIPFASESMWQLSSHSSILLQHLCHYDVIGLQTQADKANCIEVLSKHLSSINLSSKPPIIEAYPIGVDVGTIQVQADSSQSIPITTPADDVTIYIHGIKSVCEGNTSVSKLQKIIAVDRIDYSKGILERFIAYEAFLSNYPEYQGHVQLHQIASPSRLDLPTYRTLQQAVRQQVRAINQRFSTPDWQPIEYSEQALSHEALMGVLKNSDICWINSLKDGMNLVAKEYIAAQPATTPGVLMLSKHTGAAEQMKQALLVDPQDTHNLVAGLMMALTMPLYERKERHQRLLQGLIQQDLYEWQQTFLQDLSA